MKQGESGTDDGGDAAEVPQAGLPDVLVPEGRSRRLTGLIFGTAAAVAVADQLTKQVALSNLELGAPTSWFLGELLGWKLIFNPGAALSLGTGFTWVLTLLAAAVVVFIVVRARQITSRAWAFALALVLGGAVGNLVDRLFRAPGFPEGHVVDFINYAGFFVGNVADIAIVAAAGLLILLSFRGTPMTVQDGAAQDGATPDEPDPEGGVGSGTDER